MNIDFTGQAALVTGGSRGIGRDIAGRLAAAGANVAICARDKKRLSEVAAEIGAAGGVCKTFSDDLAEPGACEDVVAAAVSEFGRLDILVNNASASVDATPSRVEDITEEQLTARLFGKTLPAFRCAKAALPHMRQAGGGSIVCIGGLAAKTVFRANEAPSGGSTLPQAIGNAALASFSKYLAEEVAADSIRVNVIHPHIVKTSRHESRVTERMRSLGVSFEEAEQTFSAENPIGRMLLPEDVSYLVVFLASPFATSLTGQTFVVDGGWLRTFG